MSTGAVLEANWVISKHFIVQIYPLKFFAFVHVLRPCAGVFSMQVEGEFGSEWYHIM